MTNNKLLRNGANSERLQSSRKECPAFVAFLAVVCTVLAGLGDWKVLNDVFGGLPKAIALGTIICAFLNFLVAADFAKLRKAMGYFPDPDSRLFPGQHVHMDHRFLKGRIHQQGGAEDPVSDNHYHLCRLHVLFI